MFDGMTTLFAETTLFLDKISRATLRNAMDSGMTRGAFESATGRVEPFGVPSGTRSRRLSLIGQFRSLDRASERSF